MKPVTFALVDDDRVLHMVVKKYLEQADVKYNLLSFFNGQEIADFLANSTENGLPNLILLDLNMPIADGWKFLEDFESIRSSITKFISIYILTSSIDPDDRKRAFTYAHVKEFISKPIQPERLVEILQSAS